MTYIFGLRRVGQEALRRTFQERHRQSGGVGMAAELGVDEGVAELGVHLGILLRATQLLRKHLRHAPFPLRSTLSLRLPQNSPLPHFLHHPKRSHDPTPPSASALQNWAPVAPTMHSTMEPGEPRCSNATAADELNSSEF